MHTDTYIHTYMYIYIHTYMHACMHAYAYMSFPPALPDCFSQSIKITHFGLLTNIILRSYTFVNKNLSLELCWINV